MIQKGLARWRMVVALGALGLLCALSIASCPTPTGRERGIVDAAPGQCSGAVNPTSGGSCPNSLEGQACPATGPCPGAPSLTQLSICTCSGGTWLCGVGECDGGAFDVISPMCPNESLVGTGYACDPRLIGAYCPDHCGAVHGDISNCWCNGEMFSCNDSLCTEPEAGVPDVVDAQAPDVADASGDGGIPACPAECTSDLTCWMATSSGCGQLCSCDVDAATFDCLPITCDLDGGGE